MKILQKNQVHLTVLEERFQQADTVAVGHA